MLEASEDGREWTSLMEWNGQEYELEWKGEPVDARYVRMRRLFSKDQLDSPALIPDQSSHSRQVRTG